MDRKGVEQAQDDETRPHQLARAILDLDRLNFPARPDIRKDPFGIAKARSIPILQCVPMTAGIAQSFQTDMDSDSSIPRSAASGAAG